MTAAILLSLATIHLTAVMTPGANFLMVIQNALTYSRRTGILTVMGVATGSLLYVIAGIVGFAALISQSALANGVIRVVGAAYFLYMGYGLLRRKPRLSDDSPQTDNDTADLSQSQAYRRGLMTAIANPASALYFLSVFTTFIPATSTLGEKVTAGLMLITITLTWYSLLALTFNNRYVRRVYRWAEVWMNRVFGVMWLALAVKLLAG